jgi:deazaflavin-dependent nitroreductase family protein
MTGADGVVDSPVDWVAEHIRQYEDSDGEQGHLWRGLPTLLLSTRGRRSGTWRRTALIYGRDGENYLVVASNGGAASHPLWYLNLSEHPEVRLQVGADRFDARARTATGEDRPRLWRVMADIFPTYDRYQASTSRDIPLVILEPARS